MLIKKEKESRNFLIFLFRNVSKEEKHQRVLIVSC